MSNLSKTQMIRIWRFDVTHPWLEGLIQRDGSGASTKFTNWLVALAKIRRIMRQCVKFRFMTYIFLESLKMNEPRLTIWCCTKVELTNCTADENWEVHTMVVDKNSFDKNPVLHLLNFETNTWNSVKCKLAKWLCMCACVTYVRTTTSLRLLHYTKAPLNTTLGKILPLVHYVRTTYPYVSQCTCTIRMCVRVWVCVKWIVYIFVVVLSFAAFWRITNFSCLMNF